MKKMNMMSFVLLLLTVSTTSSWGAPALPIICTDIAVCPGVQGPQGRIGLTGPRGLQGPPGPQAVAGSSNNVSNVYFVSLDNVLSCGAPVLVSGASWAAGAIPPPTILRVQCMAPFPSFPPSCKDNDLLLQAGHWMIISGNPSVSAGVTSQPTVPPATWTLQTARSIVVCAQTSSELH